MKPFHLFGSVAFLGWVAALAVDLPPDHAERMSKGLKLFERQVRPLLADRCLKCHGGEKTKGEFDLATREALLKGGKEGPAVVPFHASTSRLLKLVRHAEEPHMPEKGDRLSPEEIQVLADWIEDGAPYDRPLVAGKTGARDRSVVSEDDRKWWAFQPLSKAVPRSGPAGDSTAIDAFLAEKGASRGLKLAPVADRRTLIRRASLDLLGLPPSPGDVEAFERDLSADAWPRLVDRLLASPAYGERWARHWLDVARFAESSGFEHDYDREGAFHYRDFVIRALNDDLPYDQFVRWQLAGDEFEPENPLALTATGFLGAGVFPTQITANEVERTRYDALDDMLSTTSQAFLGLSVGCARCHDHKYDPIPSQDYYRMLSTFTTAVRSVIDLDLHPEKTRELTRRWEEEKAPLAAELGRYEAALDSGFAGWLDGLGASARPAAWTVLAVTNATAKGGATFRKLDDGSFLAEGKNPDNDEHILVATTGLRDLRGIRLDALADPLLPKGGPGRADNGNFGLSRIRVFAVPASGGESRELKLTRPAADFQQDNDHLSIGGSLDGESSTGWAIDPQIGKDHHAIFHFAEPLDHPAGWTLTVKLEYRVNKRHSIGRPRLSVLAGAEPTLAGEVLPADVAGILARAGEAGFSSRLAATERRVVFDWWKRGDAGWKERAGKLSEAVRRKPDGRTKVLICGEGFPPLRMHSQGADFFNETHFLKRGSTDLKNGVAPQGFLQVLYKSGLPLDRWRWLPPSGSKASGRRRTLANWLTDVDSGAGSLLARVMANRLWQHHFGQGIVASPNDFGRTGAAPTHPELLDWLAQELVRHGWRLKPLHKEILLSRAYRQASERDMGKEAADPSNQLFLRRLPRRLEGEAIRDGMLAVAGRLDGTMYGPGTRDEGSVRRSIYFTVKRSQLIGSMVAFDQQEPLVSQGVRPTTTVAPQALMVMNGAQVRSWAEGFAVRVLARGGGAGLKRSVTEAYQIAVQRDPTPSEREAAVDFLRTQAASYAADGKPEPARLALIDLCQVLFGLNEFVYIP